jgi:lysyl-tRNA synthetase class 2
MLAGIRTFFARRDVLEVETPILSHAGNPDQYIDSFTCADPGRSRGHELFMHTSPEFAMKRLLAAGSGSIYQICKAFRKDEQGSLHNPEFTMLEWYRTGFDHHRLMREVEELLIALGLLEGSTSINRISYKQLFLEYAGLDPHEIDVDQLLDCISDRQINLHTNPEPTPMSSQGLCKDDLLALILTHIIEPQISTEPFLLVYDYPASQASLARIRNDDPPVAERFELYANGIELANGFNELTDSHEQMQRFVAEQRQRERKGMKKMPIDQNLVDALAHGLEACAGVALGFDRLVMVAANKQSIQEVMPFPLERA